MTGGVAGKGTGPLVTLERVIERARLHGIEYERLQTRKPTVALRPCPNCMNGYTALAEWDGFGVVWVCNGCHDNGYAITAALLEKPARAAGGARPGLTHREVLELTLQPTQHLVRDLIEAGTPGVIAGLPEAFKSWLALQIALAVASGGGLVLGREVCATGAVAYYWQDDSTANEVARIKAYAGRHGLTGDLPLTWHINEGYTLTDADIAAIRAEVTARAQVLVVLDSLYNFTPPGADLKDEAVSDVVKRIKAEVCDPTGCTVLLVDHAAWPTEANPGTRAYGSVFKSAAIRWGVYLKADATKVTYEARGNNIPRTRKTLLVWDTERLQLHVVDVEAERKAAAAELAAWVLARPGQSATTTEVCEQFKIARSTLKDRRGELAQLGVVYLDAGKLSRYCAAAQLPGDSPNRQVPPGGDLVPGGGGATPPKGGTTTPPHGDSPIATTPDPTLDPDEHMRARDGE